MNKIEIGLHIFSFVVTFTLMLNCGWFGMRAARLCTLKIDKQPSAILERTLERLAAGGLKIQGTNQANLILVNERDEKLYICIADKTSKTYGWVSPNEFRLYTYGVELQTSFDKDTGAVSGKAYSKLQKVLSNNQNNEVNLS